MVNVNVPTIEPSEVSFAVSFGNIRPENAIDLTIREITLGESLLTPGLQTSVLVDSFLHVSPDQGGKATPAKNFDDYKNKIMSINIERPMLQFHSMQTSLQVQQRIYRVDNRQLINNNNERFRVHACDDTLLNDARSLVSKSWKCTTPSNIVSEVLRACAGVTRLEVEDATPSRDYVAENIHPFQVVAQQANASLAGGSDPSFLHYMTYEDLGTHKFRSVYSLTKASPVFSQPFLFAETGAIAGYNNPYTILQYSFPCDFDLLSDLLNGIDVDGSNISSVVTTNPSSSTSSLFGNQALGCGIGGGVYNLSKTNFGTEKSQDQCTFEVEKYLLKRQARMNLLEQDKIALKVTVPWNPELNVGKMIDVLFPRKTGKAGTSDDVLYGTGRYLIVNLVHTIKSGGFSTTTMECVAQTAGQGVV